MGRLDGKVAIISGGSIGLGGATATKFGAEGAKVVIFARTEADVIAKGKELEQAGVEHIAMVADATKRNDWKRVLDATIEKFGKLDILVNNAGNTGTTTDYSWMLLDNYNEDSWREVTDAIFWSQINGITTCIDELKKTKGVIINNGSVTTTKTIGPAHAYQCAKAAIQNATTHMARQYGAFGIRVNCVIPGWMVTRMFSDDPANHVPGYLDMLMGHICLDRFGKAEDIANAICFLASDEASYITGHNLIVDGGYSL